MTMETGTYKFLATGCVIVNATESRTFAGGIDRSRVTDVEPRRGDVPNVEAVKPCVAFLPS
ncbi:MAG TPA: hypothetical protein VGJ88_02095, partial [Thermoanaerobaculia bacterium]